MEIIEMESVVNDFVYASHETVTTMLSERTTAMTMMPKRTPDRRIRSEN